VILKSLGPGLDLEVFSVQALPLFARAMFRVGAFSRGYHHESLGMMRFMNSSNMGTVKAVSP
jgi:hypothetical protein